MNGTIDTTFPTELIGDAETVAREDAERDRLRQKFAAEDGDRKHLEELDRRHAERQRREKRRRQLDGVRDGDADVRQRCDRAQMVLNRSAQAIRIEADVRVALGVPARETPDQIVGAASVSIAEWGGFANDNPELVTEALGPRAALEWRGMQAALAASLARSRRGTNPFTSSRTPVPLPAEVARLLAIARGEEGAQ